MLAAILVNGLVLSGIYGMLALGFALTYGVARILNLAHTAFYMAAAYALFFFLGLLGFAPAALLSALLVLGLALLAYWLLLEPLKEYEATVLIVTIVLALLLQEGILLLFGGHFRSVPALLPGFLEVLGVRVAQQALLALLFAGLVLLLAWALLKGTRLGLGIRAAAQDQEAAELLGISLSRAGYWAVGLGALLAALAGLAVAPMATLEPHMWNAPLLVVLAAVVLGGLGSLPGALLGAVILAFAEVLVVNLLPGGAFLRTAVALLILVLVLVLRPEGLFGAAFAEER
ncbi:MAG: branched-chain amino acid ABC transporter permease [Thermus sp.]|uniref:ABC transporter permease subunit n=1 Tax=Thermus sp. TaxID=275 RepID=UPI0025CD14EA|nr:branched-chain amino acid ABC transporter permease [Thermus sp.]MCS7219228.1 branched-chain amino acid ABC transporter permease [Thermus sp.]MCX7850465.1 branched-chain amino acid ABC transporter permease [Thermus sp.]MDW8018011.1 branched-chain amino acid ABC transporter permease [Thermus sp.]MDW8357888.1 branched-chain amino acid ABC transporter permease [Thermus sp.]